MPVQTMTGKVTEVGGLLQEGAPAAEAWRLMWQPHPSDSAACGITASQLLQAMYINPAGPALPAQLPDLAMPLTVTFSIGGARLALCLEAGDVCREAEDSRDRLMLDSAVTLHLSDIQARRQTSPPHAPLSSQLDYHQLYQLA